MAFVIILFAELILAAYILSMLVFVVIYIIKNITPKPNVLTVSNSEIYEQHLAIVYIATSNEKEILARIQELQTQPYKNYSAYFFVKQPIIKANHLSNINIISLSENEVDGLNLLEIVKENFISEPKGIIAIHDKSILSKDFLSKMNIQLLHGNMAVQSQVIINGNNESLINYQKYAKIFFGSIDREIPSSIGISACIWEQGFMLEKSVFDEIDFEIIGLNDKLLQAQIILNSVKIHYDSSARIFARTLDSKSLNAKKNRELRMYLYNLGLGFNLLFEGIKNPNLDKIIFGLNYLRPPLYLVMSASVLLFGLNQISDISFNGFTIISVLGLLVGLIVTIYGDNFLGFIKFNLNHHNAQQKLASTQDPKDAFGYAQNLNKH